MPLLGTLWKQYFAGDHDDVRFYYGGVLAITSRSHVHILLSLWYLPNSSVRWETEN